MLPESNIKNIVIVGGGTAGWMTAAAISRLLNHPEIKINLDRIRYHWDSGSGRSNNTTFKIFNQLLGLPEDDFVKKTNATFKLGIEFLTGINSEKVISIPFGPYGVPMGGLRFHHYWLRQKQMGSEIPVDEYNLQIMAAKAGKFHRPQNIKKSPLSTIDYAFHFDATLYAKYMREFSEKNGVKRMKAKL